MAFGLVAIAAPICWVIAARTGSSAPLDLVAFGPFLGPHVGFGGGGAATIYAARRGLVESGRMVHLPLIRLRNAGVLGVGGLFGTFGVLVAWAIAQVPYYGTHGDPIATTVIISAFTARFLFGDRTIINRRALNEHRAWRGRIAPTAEHCWLPHQEQPRHYLLLGALVGGLSGVVCLVLGHLAPAMAGSVNVVMFGVTGWAIIALTLGKTVWVTHHIANVAGLATLLLVPLLAGPDGWRDLGGATTWTAIGVALLAAVLAGVLAAVAAELGARLFLNRSDSFIDPPALAIAPCTLLLRALFG